MLAWELSREDMKRKLRRGPNLLYRELELTDSAHIPLNGIIDTMYEREPTKYRKGSPLFYTYMTY